MGDIARFALGVSLRTVEFAVGHFGIAKRSIAKNFAPATLQRTQYAQFIVTAASILRELSLVTFRRAGPAHAFRCNFPPEKLRMFCYVYRVNDV